MLSSAPAARRNILLRLHKWLSQSRQGENKQQAGEGTAHEHGFYYITETCDKPRSRGRERAQ